MSIKRITKKEYKHFDDIKHTDDLFNHVISNIDKRTREVLRIKYINKNDNI